MFQNFLLFIFIFILFIFRSSICLLFKFVKQLRQCFASIHNISEYIIFCEIHYKIENVISIFFFLKINIYCIFERKLIKIYSIDISLLLSTPKINIYKKENNRKRR